MQWKRVTEIHWNSWNGPLSHVAHPCSRSMIVQLLHPLEQNKVSGHFWIGLGVVLSGWQCNESCRLSFQVSELEFHEMQRVMRGQSEDSPQPLT